VVPFHSHIAFHYVTGLVVSPRRTATTVGATRLPAGANKQNRKPKRLFQTRKAAEAAPFSVAKRAPAASDQPLASDIRAQNSPDWHLPWHKVTPGL
jgi:hypothetical protein